MIDNAHEQQTAQHIAGMTREALIHELLHFNGTIRLDFTKVFLEKQSIEHLRHILLAARLHLQPINA